MASGIPVHMPKTSKWNIVFFDETQMFYASISLINGGIFWKLTQRNAKTSPKIEAGSLVGDILTEALRLRSAADAGT